MGTTTVAIRQETRQRLERLRKAKGYRSMDEVIDAAAREMEMAETVARIRRAAKGWEKLPKDPLAEEAAKAFATIDETLKLTRGPRRRRRG